MTAKDCAALPAALEAVTVTVAAPTATPSRVTDAPSASAATTDGSLEAAA